MANIFFLTQHGPGYRALRKINTVLLAFLIVGNSFFPLLVYAADRDAAASQPAGNYLWQSVEGGETGGVESREQFAGYQFAASKDAYIFELCGFFKGTHSVNLYDESFKMLAGVPITGYEQWNCAEIAPAAIAKGKKYFVAAEMIAGPIYYRSGKPDLLPRKNSDAIIQAGITQPASLPFGAGLKVASDRVLGLVDVKIASGKIAKEFVKKSGASLVRAIEATAKTASSEAAAAEEEDSQSGKIARNCARGKCIVCDNANCRIVDDEESRGQKGNTFIQTCSKGVCYSCTNADCVKTGATGVVKTGYSFKNCEDNKCVDCINGKCNIIGGEVPSYNYFGNIAGGVTSSVFSEVFGGGGGGIDGFGGGGGGYSIAAAIAAKEAEIKEAFAKGLDANELIKGLIEYLNSESVQKYMNTNPQAGATVRNLSVNVQNGTYNSTSIIKSINQLSNNIASNVPGAGGLQTKPATQSAAERAQELIKDITSGLNTGKDGTAADPSKSAANRYSSIAGRETGNSFKVEITEKASKGETITLAKVVDGQIVPFTYSVSASEAAQINEQIEKQGVAYFYVKELAPVKAFGLLNTDAASTVKQSGNQKIASLSPRGSVAGSISQSDIKAAFAPSAVAARDASRAAGGATAASQVATDWLSTGTVGAGAGGQGWGDLTYAGSTDAFAPIVSNSKGIDTGSVQYNSGDSTVLSRSQDIVSKIASGFSMVTVDKTTGKAVTTPGNPATSAFERNSDLTWWGRKFRAEGAGAYTVTRVTGQISKGSTFDIDVYESGGNGTAVYKGTLFYSVENSAVSAGAVSAEVRAMQESIAKYGYVDIYTPVLKTVKAGEVFNSSVADTFDASNAQPGNFPATPLIATILPSGATVIDPVSNVILTPGAAGIDNLNRAAAGQDVLDPGTGELESRSAVFTDSFYKAENWILDNAAERNSTGNKATANATDYAAAEAVKNAADLKNTLDNSGANVNKDADELNLYFLKDSLAEFSFGGSLKKIFSNLFSPSRVLAAAGDRKTDAAAIVGYKPVVTNSLDPVIDIDTDRKAVCKASPNDQEYDLMWATLASADGKTHQKKFNRLEEGNYTFYVRCKDEAGNVNGVSRKITFTVDGGYDLKTAANTAPPAVGAGKINVSGQNVSFEIDIKGNVKIITAEARVYDSRGRIAAVLQLRELKEGGWGYDWQGTAGFGSGGYTVDIFAQDASGNFSEKKNVAKFALESEFNSEAFIGGDYCISPGSDESAEGKIKIIFIPCGYGSDLEAFRKAAAIQVEQFSKVAPLARNKDKFYFSSVEIAGLDCGAELADNMLKDTDIFRQAARPCGQHVILVLKKQASAQKGISLKYSTIGFISADSPFAAVHEIGHMIFGLDDEYSYGCTYFDAASSPNCSNSPKCEEWEGLEGAGCFAGCTCEGNYRSSEDSVMRNSAVADGFSPAASRQITEALNVLE